MSQQQQSNQQQQLQNLSTKAQPNVVERRQSLNIRMDRGPRKRTVSYQIEHSWKHWDMQTKIVIIICFISLILVMILGFIGSPSGNNRENSNNTNDNSVDNSPDNQVSVVLGVVGAIGLIVLGVVAYFFLQKSESVSIVESIMKRFNGEDGKLEKERKNETKLENGSESKI